MKEGQGFGSIAIAPSLCFNIRSAEILYVPYGQRRHFCTVLIRCDLLSSLMGRIKSGYKPDLIQLVFPVGRFRQKQMTDMDRIKCPAHNTDAFFVCSLFSHIDHPLFSRQFDPFMFIFTFPVEDDLFADDLHHIGMGPFTQIFGDLPGIIGTVLQH